MNGIEKYENVFWLDGIPFELYQGFLQPCIPPNTQYVISPNEAKVLLKQTDAIFIRWMSHFDSKIESPWWEVVADKYVETHDLSSKVRNQLKKGYSYCCAKRIGADWLAENGYGVYRKATLYYKNNSNVIDENEYEKRILYDLKFPDLIEYYGVFYGEKLVGYAKNYIQADFVSCAVINYDPDYLKYYAGYVLIYEMLKYYLNQKKYKYFSDGARSIYHETNIQKFLMDKFQFRKAYGKLNVIYSEKYKILINILCLLSPLVGILSRIIKMSALNKIRVVVLQEEIRRKCENIYGKNK